MMPAFRVIVAGTRTFNDYGLLCRSLDSLLTVKRFTHRIVVLSGGAAGADSLGEAYARRCGDEIELFPADWSRYGNGAGPMRNSKMVREADAGVFFWDGRSRGTLDCMTKAKAKGIPIRVVGYGRPNAVAETGGIPIEVRNSIGQ